ncbi:putative tail-fiber protein [Vibrio phage CKB-S1]|nr:putative tail-fiber protein [Vibrio phage CKB-S1]
MAVNPRDESVYDGKISEANLQDYPFGQAQNITNPGDGTGTPWDQIFINEVWGLFAALLTEAGVTPNGNPETAQASQYLDAIVSLIRATSASTTQRGSVELATAAQTIEGTSTQLAITPDALEEAVRTAGTLRNAILQGIPAASTVVRGLVELATSSQTDDNNSSLAVTPAGLRSVVFGVGATLQNLTSSRAFLTTYTNTTNKPILVMVYLTDNAGNSLNYEFLIDGVILGQERIAAGTGQPVTTTTYIVPPGSTYRCNTDGNERLVRWTEFR